MEACAGFERIAIEDPATVCDGSFEIGKGREAQMVCHMRHGSPPRLMAPQSIRSADLRKSSPTPSPGNHIRYRLELYARPRPRPSSAGKKTTKTER